MRGGDVVIGHGVDKKGELCRCQSAQQAHSEFCEILGSRRRALRPSEAGVNIARFPWSVAPNAQNLPLSA